jgi:hypothetical protein
MRTNKSAKNPTLVFLVRTQAGLTTSTRKPADVKILSSRSWCVWRDGQRAFEYTESIGYNGTRFLYSNGYIGTVGVFDITKQSHVKALVNAAVAHRQEQLSEAVVDGMREIFGKKVCLEAAANHGNSSRRLRNISRNAKRFLTLKSMVYEICMPT